LFSIRSHHPELAAVIERRIDEFALGAVPEERTALGRLAQLIDARGPQAARGRLDHSERLCLHFAAKTGLST
jgi:hypothetical protein